MEGNDHWSKTELRGNMEILLKEDLKKVYVRWSVLVWDCSKWRNEIHAGMIQLVCAENAIKPQPTTWLPCKSTWPKAEKRRWVNTEVELWMLATASAYMTCEQLGILPSRKLAAAGHDLMALQCIMRTIISSDNNGNHLDSLGSYQTYPCTSCIMPSFPSVLWHCWLADRKGIRPVKSGCWFVGGDDLTAASHDL